MRKTIILFLILLSIPLSIAVEEDSYVSYEIDTVADLKIRVANVTHIIENADCWVDIYRPNGSLIVNDGSMTYIARKYNYTYIFDEVGEWFVEYYCNNTALNEISIMGRDISVKNSQTKQIWEYENRTLTNLSNVQVDITQAVWGGNYTVNTGLIAQFVYDVWDYVARYTHGEIT